MTRVPPPLPVPLRAVADADLLGRFVRDRDGAAFELLVWRYHRLVSGVCRRALGHAHDAEDAAQAAFLLLARRAETVRPATLPAWLARVAYRCALRIVRRRRHLQPLPDISVNYTTTDIDIGVDAVLHSLPDKYRVPLVLCYLHGLSYDEASERLNCPTGTLCGWLARGKELLRKRLARRGVSVPAGVFVALAGSGELTASPRQVETVTTAALAFAGGESHAPSLAETVANEVVQMTTLKRTAGFGLLAALSLVLATVLALAGDPKKPDEPKPVAKPAEKTDAEKLQGVWLFDGYRQNTMSNLGLVWSSVVTVTGNTFSITKVYDADKPFTGKFSLDPATKAIDFTLDEFDLASVGTPLKLPACTIPGLYKLDGDTLTIATEFDLAGKRPTDFQTPKKKDAVLTLKRAPKDFKAFPKEVTVKVTGPDGKPAAGAVVCGNMHKVNAEVEFTDRDGKKVKIDVLKATPAEVEKLTAKLSDGLKEYVKNIVTPPAGTLIDKATGWTYYDAHKTAADGTVKIEFEKLRMSPVIVRDDERKQMGVASVTPFGLLTGEVAVKLLPEVRVAVSGTCSEFEKAGVKNDDHFNCYLMTAGGSRFEFAGNKGGELEFVAPPGEYQLMMYGTEMMGRKIVSITVPGNQSEYAAPPVDLPATGLHRLIGQAAPELTEIAGWKGEPVKLADLKGKVVLLEFWGYWCGPCIGAMPELFALHDEFKDKGLAIVGVHVDADGEVTTAKQLDEKLTDFKKDVWKGRDIPFPVAMTSGKLKENDARGALADKYGIRGYPSTILIDRDGKVVGKFHARDAGIAGTELKKLLAEKK